MDTHLQTSEETTLFASFMGSLGEIRIAHPPDTFAITPASLISLKAIVDNWQLLSGKGIDWGSGTGCLAIAAAKIPTVERVIGLEIAEANVAIARQNAISNGVEDKTTFLQADSYSPLSADGRLALNAFAGTTNFVVANPPASDGDDGFSWRRRVLDGARDFLTAGGCVFLSISSQYGQPRIERLCDDAPGFAYHGLLATTDWVPFDLKRASLLACLRLYAVEETRGGEDYAFHDPDALDVMMNARAAVARYEHTGKSPLMKWQTHLFEFQGV